LQIVFVSVHVNCIDRKCVILREPKRLKNLLCLAEILQSLRLPQDDKIGLNQGDRNMALKGWQKVKLKH